MVAAQDRGSSAPEGAEEGKAMAEGSPAGRAGVAALARRGAARALDRLARLADAAGLPPSAAGWRHVRREPAADWAARRPGATVETVHPPATVEGPLPRNVVDRAQLDADAGWFGFSFRDAPARPARPTRLLQVGPARVVCYGGPGQADEFHPAVLAADGTALELSQIVFRPAHARALRARARPQRLARAVWILERVYDNHSHWLTSHLPKVLLLRERGLVADMVLPARRTAAMDASLRMLGVDPEVLPVVDTDRPLDVEALTLVETDRFRPELLRPLRTAMAPADAAPPRRRVFISREGSRGRHLLGEAALRPELEARGFEIVRMETLDFPAQVRLMAETAVLLAPHGAGLTNMIFCPEGAQIAEIADPAYPNPNFYALACAMGLGYRLLHAAGVGEGHPLTRDLRADPQAVLAAADAMIAETEAAPAG